MAIEEQIKDILHLHDKYAAIRYDEHYVGGPVGLIDMFNDWHGKSSVLFSKHISNDDVDLLRFKNIEKGNSYVNAGIFSDIESCFQVLIDKLRASVDYQLESLIEEGEGIAQGIKYVPSSDGVIRLYDVYKVPDVAQYQTWKNCSIRLLTIYFIGDNSVESFTSASKDFDTSHYAPKYIKDMIGILKACKDIPSVNTTKAGSTERSSTSPVTINVNQSQSQHQSQVMDIFLESISDEITGKQLKELKAIAKEESKPEEAKAKILDKVKSFGTDVLSNIVANIITNPAVWGGL